MCLNMLCDTIHGGNEWHFAHIIYIAHVFTFHAKVSRISQNIIARETICDIVIDGLGSCLCPLSLWVTDAIFKRKQEE